jgi:hypothetical protein
MEKDDTIILQRSTKRQFQSKDIEKDMVAVSKNISTPLCYEQPIFLNDSNTGY